VREARRRWCTTSRASGDDLEDFELAEEGFDVTERSINLIVLRKPAMSFPASMPILPLNYTINSADPPTLTEFYAAAQCHFLYQSRLMQHDGMRQAVAIRPPRRAGTAQRRRDLLLYPSAGHIPARCRRATAPGRCRGACASDVRVHVPAAGSYARLQWFATNPVSCLANCVKKRVLTKKRDVMNSSSCPRRPEPQPA